MSSVVIEPTKGNEVTGSSETKSTELLSKDTAAQNDLLTAKLFEPKPEVKQAEIVVPGVTNADIVTDHVRLRHDNLESVQANAMGAAAASVVPVASESKAHLELSDHMLSLTPKKKTALDEETERFLLRHPELGHHIRIAQEMEALKNAQNLKGQQALSQHALAAALDRVATNLKGDQLPIELVIPQAVSDLYKLFDVAAKEIEVEPDAAAKIINLSLFAPTAKALEAQARLLEQRALRAKKTLEQVSPKPVEEVNRQTTSQRDDYAVSKNIESQRSMTAGGLAQLEAQKQKKYEEERQAFNRQTEELAEFARAIAKEKAKSSDSREQSSLAAAKQALSAALIEFEGRDRGSNPNTAFSAKELRDAFVEQALIRSEFEAVLSKAYELGLHAAALKGSYRSAECESDLRHYLSDNEAMLARIPGGDEKLREVLMAAQQEGERSRLKVDQAIAAIADTSRDYKILEALTGLTSSELYFAARLYQERTGSVLISALNHKMDGEELNLALKILASGRREVIAPSSLQLKELAKVDIEAIRTALAERTSSNPIVALQEALKSGNATEAAELLRKGNYTAESLARVEKDNNLPSTISLIKTNYLLSGAVARLEQNATITKEDVLLVGQTELLGMAEALGVAQASESLSADRKAELARDLEKRRADLALLNYEFRNPQLVAQLELATETSRKSRTIDTLQKLSADVLFHEQHANNSGYARARANDALNALNQYQQSNAAYLNSSDGFKTEVALAIEDGKTIATARLKEAQELFGVLHGLKDGEKFLALLREKTFTTNNSQLIDDLRSLANVNGTSLERLVDDEIGIQSLEGRECRALLREDRIDAAAARLTQLIKDGKSDEVASLYSTIRKIGGDTAFVQIKERLESHYVGEIKYREYDDAQEFRGARPHATTFACKTLEEALERKFDTTDRAKIIAAKQGDRVTLDALALHKSLEGNIFGYSPDQAVKYLSSFRDAFGNLDTARINSTIGKFNELYTRSDSKMIAILNGSDLRQGTDYAQLRALAKADANELRIQQTLSGKVDQMLLALEKPEQLKHWEKVITDPKALAELHFSVQTAGDSQTKSEEQLRNEFIAEVQAASQRWSDGRKAIEDAVLAKTHLSLEDYHREAVTTVLYGEMGEEISREVDPLNTALLKAARENGELTDALRLWRNMKGLGTTSEREILEIVTRASAEGRIAQVSAELKQISGSDLKEWIRPEGWFELGELSGDDRMWVELAMAGTPKTAAQAKDLARSMTDYAESAFWVKYVPELANNSDKISIQQFALAGTNQEVIGRGIAAFMGSVTKDSLVEYVHAKENAEKLLVNHDGVLSVEQQAAYDRLQQATRSFLDRRNQMSETVVDGATTVVVVIGGTAIVVCSGGLGAAAVLTGAAGVTRIGAKAALMGDSYGHEAIALDLGKSGVDFVTLGISAKIPVGHWIQTRASTALGEAGIMAAAKGTGGKGVAVALDAAGTALTDTSVTTAGQGMLRAASSAAMQGTEVLGTRGTVNFIGTTGQGALSSGGFILKNPMFWLRGESSAVLSSAKNLVTQPLSTIGNITARGTETLARAGVGGIGGAADGALAGGIQGFGYTAIEEQTWDDGLLSGLGKSLQAGAHSAPTGALFGGTFGALMHATITPRAVKNGEILSQELTESIYTDPRVAADGRNLLNQRADAKGFLTRGDFFDAVASSKPASARQVETAFKIAETRLSVESAQASNQASSAKASLENPNLTPEAKVKLEQVRDIAQTRLSEIELARQEMGQKLSDFKSGDVSISRYEVDLWKNGQPKQQSTVVKKGFVENRLAQEKVALDQATSNGDINQVLRDRAASRIEALERMKQTLDEQAKYINARTQNVVDKLQTLKDRSVAAFEDLKESLSGVREKLNRFEKPDQPQSKLDPEVVAKETKIDSDPDIRFDGDGDEQGGLGARPKPSGGNDGGSTINPKVELPANEAGDIPFRPDFNQSSDRGNGFERLPAAARQRIAAEQGSVQRSPVDEIRDQIKALKLEPQTAEVKAELKKLYAEQLKALRFEPTVIDEITSRASGEGNDGEGFRESSGSDRPIIDEDFRGDFGGDSSPDFNGGDDWRGGGSGGTTVLERPDSVSSSRHLNSRQSGPSIRFDSVDSGPSNGSQRGFDAQNSANARYRSSISQEQPELDMKLAVLEPEAAVGVMDDVAPLIEEPSIYDTPETTAWKESRRAQAIEDLFSGAIKEFESTIKIEEGRDTQLQDIIDSSTKLSRDRAVEIRRAAKEAELARELEAQEQLSDRFSRATNAQRESDTLQAREDKFDGMVEDIGEGNLVFEETLKRIFEPDYVNQTPREHPLEKAAREARQRAEAAMESSSKGGVALMEPEVAPELKLDPRTSLELAVDPRIANQLKLQTTPRVRSIEALEPYMVPRPLPQPHKVKSPLEVEIERMFEENQSNRRYRRFGDPGGEAEPYQYPSTPAHSSKHVVPISAVAAPVIKKISHGRPKILRKNKFGVLQEVTAGMDLDMTLDSNADEQLADSVDSGRLVSTTSDT